jgi:hypothetical protein
VVVADEAGGEVRAAAALEDYFDGAVSPSAWTWGTWSGGAYGPAPAGGSLAVAGANGAWLRSANAFTQQRLEGRVTFGAGAWEHVGWADNGFASRWAVLSTLDGSGLYARTYNGGAETRTLLGGVALGVAHDVAIAWGASSVDYYVDGVLVASHPVAVGGAMYAYASDNGAAALSVDYLRAAVYAPGAVQYVSAVHDAGAQVGWGALSWAGQAPGGTALGLETQSSADGAAWSSWAAVPSSGGAIGSPAGRYLRYRATLSATATDSPRLDAVSFTTS